MNRFREALGKKEFVVTCELVPGRGYREKSADAIFEFAAKAVSSGRKIHAISVTDNPGGNPALGPDAIAAELRTMGMDAIVHFSCGNLNRNMAESRAWSLARGGQENVFVVTGDYPVSGYGGQPKPVFDIDSVLLLRYMKEMALGLLIPGRKPGTFENLAPADFFLGCGVSPFKRYASEYMMQLLKLTKKVAAGADFVITQLGYNARKYAELIRYARLAGIDRPIIGNVYVLNKTVSQLMNKNLVPGCVVTDELAAKIAGEYENPQKGKEAQLERSAQLIAVLKGLGYSGVHIGGFGLKYEDVEALLSRSDQIGASWRDCVSNLQYGAKDEFYYFPDGSGKLYSDEAVFPRKIKWRKKATFHYHLGHLVHRLVFTRGTFGFKFCRAFFGFADKRKNFMRVAYFFERLMKKILYKCEECGDCALFDLAYLCPMYGCAKTMRNGPCGGSRNRMCEADPKKRCYWTLVFERLAGRAGLSDLTARILPPNNNSLSKTSSWVNYFLDRDYNGKADSLTRRGQKDSG